jgi:glucokinase
VVAGLAALAIDVGGTKVAAGIVDAAGTLRVEATIPTHDPAAIALGVAPRTTHETPDDPAANLLERIADLARRVVDEAGTTPVAAGIGTTGHVDARRGVVLHSGLVPGWSGLALGARLGDLLGLPVAVLNDGHAMAVAEHRAGAARGADHALCVAVGTGVGGGFIHDGRLYLGARGLAGLIGHTTIAFRGRRCQCGKQGCLEAYAAGPRIVDECNRLRRRATRPETVARPPAARTLQEVSARAAAGDPVAQQALERGGTYLGAGLASLANALNPQVIVVGGGVLGAGPLWLDAVRRTVFERARHTVAAGLQVVPAALGPRAVLIGAGLAALDRRQ